MKYGVREICNVTFRALRAMKVGNKTFYKHEPVFYFDSLKTSGLEGSSSTTYAQGGRGNSRLVAWEGERTLTFNMEDALVSAESLTLLTGGSMVSGEDDCIHRRVDLDKRIVYSDHYAILPLTKDELDNKTPVVNDNNLLAIYVFIKGEEEPFVIKEKDIVKTSDKVSATETLNNKSLFASIPSGDGAITISGSITSGKINETNGLSFDAASVTGIDISGYGKGEDYKEALGEYLCVIGHSLPANFTNCVEPKLLVTHIDYYYKKKTKTVLITPDIKGANYYMEAETLFRDAETGYDYPAVFILPNCRIQSNFNVSMASSGDPSSFSFTIDALPGYLQNNSNKKTKVLAAIQIVEDTVDDADDERTKTYAGEWAVSS